MMTDKDDIITITNDMLQREETTLEQQLELNTRAIGYLLIEILQTLKLMKEQEKEYWETWRKKNEMKQ